MKTIFNSLFFEPIRGGNGVTQMDELAKYVMIWLCVYAVCADKDPMVVGELVVGVWAVAKVRIQHHTKVKEKDGE